MIRNFRIFQRNMSGEIFVKLQNNAETTEKRIAELRSKLDEIKKNKIDEKIKNLTQENQILASKVETAKNKLIELEILNGKRQYSVPGKTAVATFAEAPAPVKSDVSTVKEKKEKDTAKKIKGKSDVKASDVVDVRKLDFRIGKIVEVNKHPDADSLYVEKIDCGEERPRTVVSGLVNHVPIEELKDRIVMVMCNLKPVKMRGITSEAMVMCASSPAKVEVLIPPQEATPGDLVSCEGYPREPEVQLNPKKKIFETCAPDLMTNDDKVACYKGSPLVVAGKGPVVAPTLKGVNVK